MKILIVEDDEYSAVMLQKLFTLENHDVRVAHDADVALRVSAEFLPDLVISDWQLKSDLCGVEVCEEIKRRDPSVLTILVSGSPIEDLQLAARTLDPLDIIPKPLNFDRLDDVVQRAAFMQESVVANWR